MCRAKEWTGDEWALRYEWALKAIIKTPSRAVAIAHEALCLPPVNEEQPLSDTTAIFREERTGRIISGEVGK